MQVELSEIGKRFGRNWVFKNVNWKFNSGDCCSITGPNGSGKSTILKIISGFGLPDKGIVHYHLHNRLINSSDVYKEISIVAPYLFLIDSYTIYEQLMFQEKFKPYVRGMDSKEVLQVLDMDTVSDKCIRDCSTGMKQRIKLALAILSSSSLLLLDEPASNLDEQGVRWYHELLKNYRNDRTLLICTNNPTLDGMQFDDNLTIDRFKPA